MRFWLLFIVFCDEFVVALVFEFVVVWFLVELVPVLLVWFVVGLGVVLQFELVAELFVKLAAELFVELAAEFVVEFILGFSFGEFMGAHASSYLCCGWFWFLIRKCSFLYSSLIFSEIRMGITIMMTTYGANFMVGACEARLCEPQLQIS